jgi:Transposase DDE domain
LWTPKTPKFGCPRNRGNFKHRASGEKKYYLANLPAKTALRTLAATIKARWICEQAHQQLKEELGLDHFEGRSWQGLHRHALMTMIAYAFLQHRRTRSSKAEKKESTGRRLNRPCQPCARPCSNSSLGHHHNNARTADYGSAASSGMSKSAKVVLGRFLTLMLRQSPVENRFHTTKTHSVRSVVNFVATHSAASLSANVLECDQTARATL